MAKTLGEIHHHKERTEKSIHGYIFSIQIVKKRSRSIVSNVSIHRHLLRVIPAAIT